MHRRDERIHRLFDGLRYDDTSQMNLPQHFSSLLRAKQQKKTPRDQEGGGGGDGGGGGGGGEEKGCVKKKIKRDTPNDKKADMTKPKPDEWSPPESVADPLAKFFGNNAVGKTNKERWDKIRFKHHSKVRGSDRFEQTALCRNYHVMGSCSAGFGCKQNHRSCRTMLCTHSHEIEAKVADMDAVAISIFQLRNQKIITSHMGKQRYQCGGDELSSPR